MQFSHLFEVTGAFVLWVVSGFRGRFKDLLAKNFLTKRQPNYKTAYLGVLVYVMFVIFLVQLI